MGWDELLPIGTLVIGFLLGQASEFLRDRREREWIVIQQQVDIQTAALVELQDLLWKLLESYRAASLIWRQIQRAEELGVHDDQEGDTFLEAIFEADEVRQRAVALASRIADDDLRDTTHRAIRAAAAEGVFSPDGALLALVRDGRSGVVLGQRRGVDAICRTYDAERATISG